MSSIGSWEAFSDRPWSSQRNPAPFEKFTKGWDSEDETTVFQSGNFTGSNKIWSSFGSIDGSQGGRTGFESRSFTDLSGMGWQSRCGRNSAIGSTFQSESGVGGFASRSAADSSKAMETASGWVRGFERTATCSVLSHGSEIKKSPMSSFWQTNFETRTGRCDHNLCISTPDREPLERRKCFWTEGEAEPIAKVSKKTREIKKPDISQKALRSEEKFSSISKDRPRRGMDAIEQAPSGEGKFGRFESVKEELESEARSVLTSSDATSKSDTTSKEAFVTATKICRATTRCFRDVAGWVLHAIHRVSSNALKLYRNASNASFRKLLKSCIGGF